MKRLRMLLALLGERYQMPLDGAVAAFATWAAARVLRTWNSGSDKPKVD